MDTFIASNIMTNSATTLHLPSAELAAESLISATLLSATLISANSIASPEARVTQQVTQWLEKLLQHFGINQLDESSDQQLASLLARCGENDTLALQDTILLSKLKRRIVRLAGAQLDDAFVAMAPDVIDEDTVELITLPVASRYLQGIRHQQEVYRLVDTFEPCHRLQAFCLGQTLNEQKAAYLITRSAERFAVWVNVRSLPNRNYPEHLPSYANLSDLGR